MAKQSNSSTTKSNKSKLPALEPNRNTPIQKSTPRPKKQYSCVICDTQVVDHGFAEHQKTHRHKQLLAFLLALHTVDKKGDHNTEKLPSDTLKAASGLYCYACKGSLPPPIKAQDHLALSEHRGAVDAQHESFQKRASSLSRPHRSQILRGCRLPFLKATGRDVDDE